MKSWTRKRKKMFAAFGEELNSEFLRQEWEAWFTWSFKVRVNRKSFLIAGFIQIRAIKRNKIFGWQNRCRFKRMPIEFKWFSRFRHFEDLKWIICSNFGWNFNHYLGRIIEYRMPKRKSENTEEKLEITCFF